MSVPAFRPEGIFEALSRHQVRYVLIGGLAATLHGSPLVTQDVDICPASDDDNLPRLSAALRDLDARVWSDREPEGVPSPADPSALAQGRLWNLVTRFGRLDLSFLPSGTQGFPDLAREAVTFRLDDLEIPTASLLDVIRSKEAAGRERDRQALPTLRKLLERTERED